MSVRRFIGVAVGCSLFLGALATTTRGQTPANAGPTVVMLTGYMIVPDQLEKSAEFYSHLLGLQMPNGDPRARLKWYDVVPFLTEMYGVKERARNFTLRVPGADIGVEPMQWSASKGQLLQPRLQDPGASQLVLTVNDVDGLLGWLTKGGAKVVTAGGRPIQVSAASGTTREVVVQDFHGYYVRLVEPVPAPTGGGANGAPPPSYIIGANVAITVDDTEKTARFYQDVLGLTVQVGSGFQADPSDQAVLGMKDTPRRDSTVMFPGKSQVRLLEFKSSDRKAIHPGIVDSGAVVLRVQVRGIDAFYEKVKATNTPIMSVSGAPYLNGRTRWLMLRDPNNVYVQLVEQPQAPTP